MNHLPVCAEQVVHWPYCLDFPSHILDRFFLISSTQKDILFVLLSPSSNILADKPQLAQSLFWYDLCPFASTTGAMTFSWTKIPPSFEIWWSHYFRRILFPGKLSKGNCSLYFLELFLYSSCEELSHTLRKEMTLQDSQKKILYAFRVTFTSVHFTKSS